MISARQQPFPRAGLLLAGLGIALALRLTVAGIEGAQSALAGLVFATALLLVVLAAGWRPGQLRPGAIAVGVLGAAGLVAVPTWLRLTGATVPAQLPLDALLSWAMVVSAVAVTEELLLRGILFTDLESAWGAPAAVGVTAAAFGLLHVPLYGWEALPLDLAVGVWLGGLRIISRTVAAPAVAHTLADLAAWWLA